MTDATVVGSGPNGLAAAIELARAGLCVRVIEAADRIGGGTRSAELTLPGFVHDVCSAVHPLALASPFFRSIALPVEWAHPDVPLAHPLDDGSAVLLERSVDDTAAALGRDAPAYRRLVRPLLASMDAVVEHVLGPIVRVPRHPVAMARFGVAAARSMAALSSRFAGERAPALLAGNAAHSMLPLDRAMTGGFGLLLTALGHAVGWPVARGGSQSIAGALADALRAAGGTIETGRRVTRLDEIGGAPAVLDVTPRRLLEMSDRWPSRYARGLRRYRYGPGVFKLDWALGEPIPWKAPECARAGTVHLGGSFAEIAAGEQDVWRSRVPGQPFVILAQPTLFDSTRAPAGRHVAWAYCHVPAGCPVDMSDAIEAQVERFAPGFRDVVLARSARAPADLERDNANYVGGDINGGVQDLRQTLARPVPAIDPYATPLDGVFVCSSSTPPGGGVHGMCGYHAARSVLRRYSP